jgi:hypothetical protein
MDELFARLMADHTGQGDDSQALLTIHKEATAPALLEASFNLPPLE